jgi:hypothetical protein
MQRGRMTLLSYALEHLHVKTQAISDFFNGDSGAQPLGQAFWFGWAWQVVGTVPWTTPRYLL